MKQIFSPEKKFYLHIYLTTMTELPEALTPMIPHCTTYLMILLTHVSNCMNQASALFFFLATENTAVVCYLLLNAD